MDEVDESKRATLKRFGAIGAVSPFARFAGDNDDDGQDRSDRREAIVGYLATTPGAHFSKLRDDLKLGTGEAQHHLRRLESDGSVESEKDGDYRRYFPSGRFSAFEKRALGYLRRETARKLVLALLSNPDATGGDLAAELGVSRPTVSRYVGELESAGLLSREDGYELVAPERLLVLVVRYADSFGSETVAFAADASDLLSYDPTS
ncbi:winged helix-turn-helix transcriptional regulator [Halosegnis longus]|uniref:winged helix-turn-helix transcriptional regulator n=1 Tax=Halosegnis longus TaxID=2216012 RepID=UPI00096AA47D|nr:winged helix-turn-helix transcriptional regulator [Salella cibi]